MKAKRKRYAAEYKFDKLKRLDVLIADGSVIELARQATRVKKLLNNTWSKRVSKNSGNMWNKKNAKAFAV